MEEKEETISVKIPKDMDDWIKDIQKEFKARKGFCPSKTDILKNIVIQFRGKFIV